MKIFPKDSSSNLKTIDRVRPSEAAGLKNNKKGARVTKKELSDSAIKEKLAAHIQTSDAARNMSIKNTKKLGENFMSDEIKPIVDMAKVKIPIIEGEEIRSEGNPNTKDFILKSDIAQNDPKDTNTQEKLKSALVRGAFNFNSKEREALEKILGT